MADLIFGNKNNSADLAFGESENTENQIPANPEDLVFNQRVPANGELVFGQAQSAQASNPEDLVFADPIPTNGDLVFGEQDDNTGTQPNQSTITGTLQILSLQFGGSITNDVNVSRGVKTSSTAHYNKADDVKQSVRGTFLKAKSAKTTATELVQKAEAVKHQNKALFEQSPRIKSSTSEAFEKADRISNSAKTSWKKPGRIRTDTAAVYEKGIQRAITRSELFKYPPVARAKVSDAWSKAADLNVQIAEHYSAGRKLLIDRRAVWEKAGFPAAGKSVTPDPVEPELPKLPPGEPVDLVFSELWDPLAYRVLVFGKQPDKPVNLFDKVVVIMTTATLQTVPSGDEIQATNVTWSTDIDSWTWGFTATLQKESDIELLKPDSNGMKEVSCEINGHTFTGLVERFSSSRNFESGITWKIAGRSLSAKFSDPFTPKSTGSISTNMSARQVVESLIQNSGWTLDWQVPDWIIPANTLNWSAADKVEVINKIVSAIGARLQSHQSDKKLIVKSRYPVSPHKWADPNTAIKTTLPANLIESHSAEFIQRPNYNGAIVVGSSSIYKAKLDGTQGEITPNIVVEPLLSDANSGRERARVEIAKGGQWEALSTTTWLTNPGQGPALILPGDLIEIVDLQSTYRTQVDAISVAVKSTNNGLDVKQTITAEKLYG